VVRRCGSSWRAGDRCGSHQARPGTFLPGLAGCCLLRSVDGASCRELLGGGVSGEASYDVYVKVGVDLLGRDEFGEAVAHFVEQNNAVALKRRLEARGETVRIEKGVVYGLSESGKESWLSDYSRVTEYELPRAQASPAEPGPSREPPGGPQSAAGGRG
jgi:hypothetical protein